MDTLIDSVSTKGATTDTARARIGAAPPAIRSVDVRRRPPIVNLHPPPLAVRRSVTRLLIDLFARRALVDLGVIADRDAAVYDGSAP